MRIKIIYLQMTSKINKMHEKLSPIYCWYIKSNYT